MVRSGSSLTTAVIALLLPKCPLCVAAWAGLFTLFGLDFSLWTRWKWLVTMTLLGVAVLLIGGLVKPIVRTVLIAAAALAMAFKMASESQFSPTAVAIWLLAMIVLAAAQDLIQNRRLARMSR